jgi:hypothetical protein
MDEEIVKQILHKLFSLFEDSETQSAALLLLPKDQGIATEEKLAPYAEQAANTSEVRWRAGRVRMGALLASALKTPEPATEKKTTAACDFGECRQLSHQEPGGQAPGQRSDARGYHRASARPAPNLIASQEACGNRTVATSIFPVAPCIERHTICPHRFSNSLHACDNNLRPFASAFWESEGRGGSTAFEKLRAFLVNGCQLQMRTRPRTEVDLTWANSRLP